MCKSGPPACSPDTCSAAALTDGGQGGVRSHLGWQALLLALVSLELLVSLGVDPALGFSTASTPCHTQLPPPSELSRDFSARETLHVSLGTQHTVMFFQVCVTRNATSLSRKPSKTRIFLDFACLPSGYASLSCRHHSVSHCCEMARPEPEG